MQDDGKLKLSILCPDKPATTQVVVKSVTLFGSEGQIQVLPGHAAMLGNLDTGGFSYEPAEGGKAEVQGVISSGFFEIKDGEIAVAAATFELASDIDLQRAKTAQKKAEEALQSPELSEDHFRKYQLKLQRALIRQQFASKISH